jgi:hypothetical protein
MSFVVNFFYIFFNKNFIKNAPFSAHEYAIHWFTSCTKVIKTMKPDYSEQVKRVQESIGILKLGLVIG